MRKTIRQNVMARRAAMPEQERVRKSAEICQQLLQRLDVALGERAQGAIVGAYSAFPDEVDLDAFVRGAQARGAHVAFPVMTKDAWAVPGCGPQTMEFRVVEAAEYATTQQTLAGKGASKNTSDDEALTCGSQEGAYFLLHPLKRYVHDSPELAGNSYVAGDRLDFLVVPCVAFDAQGNRLGYGGGNYDRYLPQLSPECHVVAAAFEEQRVEAIPVEPHDIPLEFVIA